MSAPSSTLGAAIALAAVTAVAACGPPPPTKVEQHVHTLENETTPDKLVARGRAFAAVGDLTRAEQYLAAALDQGANPDVAMPILMRVCVSEGRYRVAIDYAEPQLRKRPNDHRLRFVVASLYATIGDTKTARDYLEQVAEAEPNHADVHFALGRLLRDDAGDRVAADEHFREYLRIDPKGPHAEEARASLLKVVP